MEMKIRINHGACRDQGLPAKGCTHSLLHSPFALINEDNQKPSNTVQTPADFHWRADDYGPHGIFLELTDFLQTIWASDSKKSLEK